MPIELDRVMQIISAAELFKEKFNLLRHNMSRIGAMDNLQEVYSTVDVNMRHLIDFMGELDSAGVLIAAEKQHFQKNLRRLRKERDRQRSKRHQEAMIYPAESFPLRKPKTAGKTKLSDASFAEWARTQIPAEENPANDWLDQGDDDDIHPDQQASAPEYSTPVKREKPNAIPDIEHLLAQHADIPMGDAGVLREAARVGTPQAKKESPESS